MSTGDLVRGAVEALKAAVEEVDEIRVYTDPGATVDPPGVVIAPPTLTSETYGLGFTLAAFRVVVVTAADEYAVERLWDLVPAVSEAIERNTDGAVTRAAPGQWGEQGAALPCYELTVEMGLS